MAGKRKRANGWEYVVKKAGLLDKPIYLTFDSEQEGDKYVKRLEALLDRGIVPTDVRPDGRILTIEQLARAYLVQAHPSPKDIGALGTVVDTKGKTPLMGITAQWVDEWISELKRVDKLAPATIRAKVGALARCCDWGIRKDLLQMPDRPLRALPNGYAQYTKLDSQLAGLKRTDVERDRRLEPAVGEGADEHARILSVIQAEVLPRKLRPYALPDPAALRCMYMLALESAMRMREMYTLTLEQLSLDKRTVFLDKTKNGDKRQVPLSSIACQELKRYLPLRAIPAAHPKDLLFPWWDGDTSQRALAAMSDYLSNIFAQIFKCAACKGLTFHDLRHEATSRLFELTSLSESQIMKITGHKSHRMMMRYANLRGSDLADKLW